MKKQEKIHTEENCPIGQVVKLIGDKWTMLIIRDLLNGRLRFGELQKSTGNINPRTLSSRLSKLEKIGMVKRHAYAEIPPRVEYSLTKKGYALESLLDAMRDYADNWLAT